MPSQNKEVLNANAKKHYDKIKNDPEVRRKARERASAWYAANKERAKKYREENKEIRRSQLKEWKEANPERVKKHKAKSQSINMDSHKKRMDKYRATENGKNISYAVRDSYRRRVRLQSLDMYDKEKILVVYKSCRFFNEKLPDRYEVDHIVPIKGVGVSGLHVSWNLRIITISENRKKSNKLDPYDVANV